MADLELYVCRDCGEALPRTEEHFYKVPRGFRGECRRCTKARSVAYRLANLEANRARERARYRADPEPQHARSKAWSQRNAQKERARLAALYASRRDEIRQRARQWSQQHAEQKRATDKAWRAANLERNRENMRVAAARRRARVAQAEGTHTRSDLSAILYAQRKRCWYCGGKLHQVHFDHRIPLSRGGSNGPENIVASCPPCNLSKGSKMPWEMKSARLL